MRDPPGKILKEAERVQEDVPGVPAQEAPDVNPQAAEAGCHNHKKPTGGAVPDPGRHPVNQMEGKESQAKTDESKEENQNQVGPEETARCFLKMNEVGHDVR